jgi:NADH-quinone oxidoreductase subunit H
LIIPIILQEILKTLIVVISVLLGMAYLTYAERRVIGFIQSRLGPNRVGPYGLLQPFADGLKLIAKESIQPTLSNKGLFQAAPIIAFTTAIAVWGLLPISPKGFFVESDIGLLMLLTLNSIGVYGIMIAGWASNSKYALLGSLRSAAQVLSYEIGMGVSFIAVIMASGSMNLKQIILGQTGSILDWYIIPLFPLFIIYWICALAETNRLPFDVAEGESELVGGYHVEYSGWNFALFFLAEYINMIVVSVLATILFLGGYLSPFENTFIGLYLQWIPPTFWLMLKTAVMLFSFLWIRATLPRYRYDQLMRLGWKILIPSACLWLFLVMFMAQYHVGPWFK